MADDRNHETESLNATTTCKLEKESRVEKTSFCEKFLRQKGIFYTLFGSLLASISGIFAKHITYYNGSELTTIRFCVQFLIMLIIAIIKKEKLLGEPDKRRPLLLRAFFGTIGLLLFTISFKLIDPSDVISLANCSIIIVSVLSRIILKEKYTICHFIALILTSLGVFLICEPSFLVQKPSNFSNNSNQTFLLNADQSEKESTRKILGISFSLIVAFCSAFVVIILKKLANKKVHFSIPIIYASYFGLPLCSVVSIVLLLTGYEVKKKIETLPLLYETIFALIAGFAGLFGQILMTLAFFYDDVTKISLIRSTEVLFTFVLQYIFLNIHSNIYSLTGALLILISVIMVISYQIMDQKFTTKHKNYLDAKNVKKKSKKMNNDYNKEEVQNNFIKPNLIQRILFYKF